MSRQNRTVLRALAVLGPVKSRDFKPDACRNAAPDHMLERARSEVFCACRRENSTSRCSRMRTLTEKRSLPDSCNVALGPDNIQAMSSTLLQVCLRGTCSSSICEPATSGAIMLPRTMAKQGPGPSIACPWSVVRYNLAAVPSHAYRWRCNSRCHLWKFDFSCCAWTAHTRAKTGESKLSKHLMT